MLVPKIHHAIDRVIRNSYYCSHRILKHNNLHHDKMQRLETGIFLDLLYPKSSNRRLLEKREFSLKKQK